MKTSVDRIKEFPKSIINRLNPALLKITRTNAAKILIVGIFTAFAFVWIAGLSHSQTVKPSDGPANQGNPVRAQTGNIESGQQVFRFETFGNEGFWTDAVRTPQGMVAAKVTPMQALQLGLSVDVEALDDATKKTVAADLKADPTGHTSKLLNDPMTTVKLVSANAVIGLPIKDSNGDGKLDAMNGDKVGVSCALCHSGTDGSVFSLPEGGSIGRREDNLTNHNLNVGKILAAAANSRALYPVLQLSLKANRGKTLGRAPKGLTEKSSEAEVDAYLSNPDYYPIGTFDDTFDGNGDPMHITPFFRQDLAAPFGSDGSIARLDNFNNVVFTALFDLTGLTTPGGRAFIHKLGGAAGDEIVNSYVKILKETNVTGYPYVQADKSANPDSEEAPLGLRVDNAKLLDLNAYVIDLPAPKGEKGDRQAINRGRELFKTQGCTVCHNVDQSKPVPANIIPMKTIFPGDNPVILAQRMPPLNPVMDTPGFFFDDKMAVLNATLRGDIRGIAMPLLFELARKPVFLHDNSVPSLDNLFDPSRGANAPHPFYLTDMNQRMNIITYLRSLDDKSK